MKLSDKQKEVIKFMRKGFNLYQTRFGDIITYLHDNDFTMITIKKTTLESLYVKNLIYFYIRTTHISIYKLTYLGKNIQL